MLNPAKTTKYRKALDTVGAAFYALDDLPDNPNDWTADERAAAQAAILTLGAPESFLRRFARADLG